MTVLEIINKRMEIDNILTDMADSYDENSKQCILCLDTANKILHILKKYSDMLGNMEVKG